MPIKQVLSYTITPAIASALMRIERAKERILFATKEESLRRPFIEKARVQAIAYSSQLEGSHLTVAEVQTLLQPPLVLSQAAQEVKGYEAALLLIDKWVNESVQLDQNRLAILHGVMLGARQPSSYRQIGEVNDSLAAYLPTQAQEIPALMQSLFTWLKESSHLPCPLVAAIAHGRLLSTHPFDEGNGKIARLLTNYILATGGYALHHVYALEAYYAKEPGAYFSASTLSYTVDHQQQRQADVTAWLTYFVQGMRTTLEEVLSELQEGKAPALKTLCPQKRQLDSKQREVLALFASYEVVTSSQIGQLFNYQIRTASALCKKWVDSGFLQVIDFSKKGRKYVLNPAYHVFLEESLTPV